MSKVETRDLRFYYDDFEALEGISMCVEERRITALIGPSGCGKSTYLRCLNRMNDTISGTRVEGQVLLDGKNIYAPDVDVVVDVDLVVVGGSPPETRSISMTARSTASAPT